VLITFAAHREVGAARAALAAGVGRARERFGDTPVVLLAASDDLAIEEQALAAGAPDFLGEDELTPRTLRRVIRYAVG